MLPLGTMPRRPRCLEDRASVTPVDRVTAYILYLLELEGQVSPSKLTLNRAEGDTLVHEYRGVHPQWSWWRTNIANRLNLFGLSLAEKAGAGRPRKAYARKPTKVSKGVLTELDLILNPDPQEPPAEEVYVSDADLIADASHDDDLPLPHRQGVPAQPRCPDYLWSLPGAPGCQRLPPG